MQGEPVSPGRRLLFYVPADNNLCSALTPIPSEYRKGELFIGVALDNILTNLRMTPEARHHVGEIQARNLASRERAGMHEFPEMDWGALLVTAGDVLFADGCGAEPAPVAGTTAGRTC